MSEEDYFVRVTKLKLDYKDKDTGKDASSIVHHYQWENWPDRGVPQSKFTAIQYLYIHRVLLAYFLEKYRTRFGHILENGGDEKYRQWCADYKQATGCD
ncbi:hypothetical protein OSTOST_09083 [Ostertagia ostertagi]